MAFFMRNGANCRLSCCSCFASFPIEILKSNQHHLPTNDLNPFLHKNTFWKSFPKVHFSLKINSFFFIKDIDINVVSKCVYECFLMPSVMCTDGMHDQLFVCDAWPIRWRLCTLYYNSLWINTSCSDEDEVSQIASSLHWPKSSYIHYCIMHQ